MEDNKGYLDNTSNTKSEQTNKSHGMTWFIVIVVVLLVAIGITYFYVFKEAAPINTEDVNQSQTNNIINNSPVNIISAENVVGANNQFAMDLYSKYKSKEGNVFYSPYSISSALTMTYEGAKGRTAQEIQAVLHLPNSIDEVRSGYQNVNNELNKADKQYNLSVANALWTQEDYPFINTYLENVEEFYDGKATNLNFKTDTENSRITINNWVENKTNNRIKDLIAKEVLLPDTKLVLTNAVYFKANWSKQFNVDKTHNGTFTLGSGQNITSEFMSQEDNFSYGETGNLKILEMNYLGNDLSMIVILPKENKLSDIENEIKVDNLKNWKNSMSDEKVIVILPKFKFETKYDMSDDLKQMGMPTAFKYPDADFTGISPPTANSPNGELYISAVIHQTFIEVAEYGTEAAAATAVIMSTGSSGPIEQPKYFIADHPFIFIIQQKSTGNILFIGRMSNPQA